MLNGMKIVDCDGHVAEPFDLYMEYCDPEFRDRVPRRIERNGERRVLVDGKEYPGFVKYGGRPLGMEDDAKIQRPVQQAAISEGGVDPNIRLRDMGLEGIDVAILYPSGATSLCAIENPELETAVYRAYNRWLAQYCAANTDRLKGMIVISMRHPELGVQELLRVVEEPWMIGILLSPHIDDYNLDHPRFNPIFEIAQHHDLPICFHAGAGRPPYAMGTYESSGNLFLMHAFAHPFEQMRAMAALMGGGVLDCYPRLRTGFIESGIGWVPWWLDRLEEHSNNLPDHVPLMRRRPIEYLEAGQCFVNCTPHEATLETVIATIGDGNVLFGSDYPHWDCAFPGAVQRMRDRKLPQESLARIFWDNAVTLHRRLS
jgi:uncharacterized protein